MDKINLSKLVKENFDWGVMGVAGGIGTNILFKMMDAEINPYVLSAALTATTDLIGYGKSGSFIKEVRNDIGTFMGTLTGIYAINFVNYLTNLPGN